MKILFLTTTFARFPGDPEGGAGNCYLDLFLELSKTNDVTVVAPLLKNSKNYEEIKKLKICRVGPIKPPRSLESIIKSKDVIKVPKLLINMFWQAKKLVKKNSFDVLHAFFVVPSGLLCALLTKKHALKVISCLGTDIHTVSYLPLMSEVYRWIFHKTDGVIYNTPEMGKRLLRLGVKKMKYIPTPLNLREFPINSKLPSSPIFVFVGRLSKQKGIDVLLDSFLLVKKNLKKAKLKIIGDGPEASYIQNFIKKNKIQDSIKFLGFQSRNEIVKALWNSYALLLPSFREGTPSVVLEAMSVGRPIVATKVGDLKRIIKSDVGILTNTGCPDEFARGTIEVFRRKFNPHTIHNRVLKFDVSNVASEYLYFYESLMDKK